MHVSLGKFARAAIEARLGSNVRVGVLAALQHYTRRLRSGLRPVAPPRFFRDLQGRGKVDTTFELQVGRQMRADLERHARWHHVPLNHVLVHAVFVYLADLEASSSEARLELAPEPLGRRRHYPKSPRTSR